MLRAIYGAMPGLDCGTIPDHERACYAKLGAPDREVSYSTLTVLESQKIRVVNLWRSGHELQNAVPRNIQHAVDGLSQITA